MGGFASGVLYCFSSRPGGCAHVCTLSFVCNVCLTIGKKERKVEAPMDYLFIIGLCMALGPESSMMLTVPPLGRPIVLPGPSHLGLGLSSSPGAGLLFVLCADPCAGSLWTFLELGPVFGELQGIGNW